MDKLATTGLEPGNATHQQPIYFTSTYKHINASIAFVLMIIAATGWGV